MELELALLQLSATLTERGLPTLLKNSGDLDRLIPAIEEAINSVKLWEFYVFDVQSSVREVAAALDSGKVETYADATVAGQSIDQLASLVKSQDGFIDSFRAYSGRYVTKADPAKAASLIKANSPNSSNEELAAKWGKVLDVLNVDLYAECNEDVKAAKDGVIGRIRYTRVDEHGPRTGDINAE